MKIALVTEWLDAWRGGAETSTLQFMHHLMDCGIEVHVFTRSRPSPTPGLHVHTMSGAAMSRTRRSVTFFHRVERQLAGESFDIVHAISPCRGADIYQPRGGTVAETVERNLALIKSPTGRRLKRYANRLNLKQRYMLALERRLLGTGEGPVVVAISDYVEDQLKRHYRLPTNRIRRIYNGVDRVDVAPAQREMDRTNIRREFGIADDDSLVLLVAHNFRLKGVERWMEALALLVDRGVTNVRSLVVGRGDSDRWHRLAARLRISDRLIFTGPSERVPQLRSAADVLVHPTYYDPCSRVVLEALVDGLPCITTRWDGASEMIEEAKNGFVLDDPRDTHALADRVERLRDRAFRPYCLETSMAVRDRVSMTRHTREMIVLYEDVSKKVGRQV